VSSFWAESVKGGNKQFGLVGDAGGLVSEGGNFADMGKLFGLGGELDGVGGGLMGFCVGREVGGEW